MDKEPRTKSAVWSVACLLLVALASALLSFFVARHFALSCAPESKPLFPDTVKWESGERVELPDSAYVLYVSADDRHCFLLPKAKSARGQTLVVAEPRLSGEMVEELGGLGAYLYCKSKTTTLLRPPRHHEVSSSRTKRESALAYVPPQGGMSDEDYRRRMQGLLVARQDREPRCMDTFIDCGTQVGQVHKCYTGLNGIFMMEQECLSPTRFNTRMYKPPGRILKILQGQILECLRYKRVNAEKGRLVRC